MMTVTKKKKFLSHSSWLENKSWKWFCYFNAYSHHHLYFASLKEYKDNPVRKQTELRWIKR